MGDSPVARRACPSVTWRPRRRWPAQSRWSRRVTSSGWIWLPAGWISTLTPLSWNAAEPRGSRCRPASTTECSESTPGSSVRPHTAPCAASWAALRSYPQRLRNPAGALVPACAARIALVPARTWYFLGHVLVSRSQLQVQDHLLQEPSPVDPTRSSRVASTSCGSSYLSKSASIEVLASTDALALRAPARGVFCCTSEQSEFQPHERRAP